MPELFKISTKIRSNTSGDKIQFPKVLHNIPCKASGVHRQKPYGCMDTTYNEALPQLAVYSNNTYGTTAASIARNMQQ